MDMIRQNSINDTRFQILYYLNNKKLTKKDLFECLYNIEESYYKHYKHKNKKQIFIFLIQIYSIKEKEIHNFDKNPILKEIFIKKPKHYNFSNFFNIFYKKKTKKLNIKNYSYLIQGKRKYMEDRIILNNNKLFNFSCILDGHGGHHCADFLKDNLYKNFCSYLKNNYEIKRSIKLSFNNLNKRFLTYHLNSGSTCNLLIINKNINKFVLANVGDSRCIAYYDNNKIKQISIDHRPDLIKEKIRIELLGGKIIKNRVQGILGLTRSFGDRKIRKFIQPIPDIYEGKINNIKYFLQGSDGVFDYASNKEIINFFNKCLKKTKNNYKISIEMLMKYIFRVRNSKDNISIIVTVIH
jgi:serine/threonine protein phosphatase PrpC